jgi:uncharacterized membrane protein YeaQ/YmgE (transglycosylase-associated protein family)
MWKGQAPENQIRTLPMHILWTIIIGFLAGLIAKLTTPGRDPGGFIVTTLLGIVGALVATYLGQAIGWYRAGESAGFVGAVVGAVIVLAIYSLRRKPPGSTF